MNRPVLFSNSETSFLHSDKVKLLYIEVYVLNFVLLRHLTTIAIRSTKLTSLFNDRTANLTDLSILFFHVFLSGSLVKIGLFIGRRNLQLCFFSFTHNRWYPQLPPGRLSSLSVGSSRMVWKNPSPSMSILTLTFNIWYNLKYLYTKRVFLVVAFPGITVLVKSNIESTTVSFLFQIRLIGKNILHMLFCLFLQHLFGVRSALCT